MKFFPDFFRYTFSEQRGILLLLIVVIVFLFISFTIREKKPDIDQSSLSQDPFLIEINSADSSKLTLLYGIGPSYARRIIKYRELLGGYIHKKQLLEVYGMDSIRYNMFEKDVIVDTTGSIRKILVNRDEFKTILRHPYISYELTKAIFSYRNKKDTIRNMNQLVSQAGISPEHAIKLDAYLDFR